MSRVAIVPASGCLAASVLAIGLMLARPAAAQSPGGEPAPGPLAVRSLSIQGVSDVDAEAIKNVLVTRESGRLPLLGRDRFFSRVQFQQDLYRIVAYLSDQGFPQARVASVDIDERPARGDVHLTVHVEQGPPVMVARVEVYGFDVLSERDQAAIERRLRIREGERRVQADVRAGRAAALAVLQERGYAHARVDILEGEIRPGHVTIVLAADPGPLTTFGPITVRGSDAVSDGRVKSLLTFREGDLFRLSRLQDSQRRLYNREVFQFVTVDLAQTETRAPEVPVNVTLTTARRYRVSVAPGYGSEERARVTSTLRHVNFFGGARTGSVQGKWSSLDRGARLNFEEPSLFRRGISMGTSLQYWYADEPAYSLLTSGGRVTLARELTRSDPVEHRQALTTASLTFVHEYEDYAISDFALEDLSFRDEIIALGLDPTRGTGGGTLVALGFDIQRNTTQNLIDARQGYLVQFHVEQAGRWMPGDFSYTEYSGEGRYYATVPRRAVLAARLRLSTMSAPGTLPASIPFFKRYFLGGASSLRGWGRFQVSPLSGSGLPIGGHSFAESSIEARVPVAGAVSTVLFLDAGNAWSGSFDFRPDDLRYALGTGLRYLTPIGPVRLDVGYQLNPIAGLLVDGVPEARRWRLHFSIGQAF
jgi:outer membrane protein assembly complex protein YaeT